MEKSGIQGSRIKCTSYKMWVKSFAHSKDCFCKKSLQSCLVKKKKRITLILTAVSIAASILKVYDRYVLDSQKCNFFLLYLNVPLWGHVCLGCISCDANQSFLKVVCLMVLIRQTKLD